jgi:hypothetical protein
MHQKDDLVWPELRLVYWSHVLFLSSSLKVTFSWQLDIQNHLSSSFAACKYLGRLIWSMILLPVHSSCTIFFFRFVLCPNIYLSRRLIVKRTNFPWVLFTVRCFRLCEVRKWWARSTARWEQRLNDAFLITTLANDNADNHSSLLTPGLNYLCAEGRRSGPDQRWK